MDRLIQEAHDPETGVILFDLLYGYAIHPDPVGAIEDRRCHRRLSVQSIAAGM